MESSPFGRNSFDAELRRLEHDILQMGSLAEVMVGEAAEALVNLDTDRAMSVLRRDDDIDQRELAIENHCIRLLAMQHPVAGDLRAVSTAMKMITDVERVGDLAGDIAKAAMKIEKEFGTTDYIDILKIANVSRGMLREALEAYVRRDDEITLRVCRQDDVADDLYRELRDQIHEHMRQEPESVVSASWLLLAVHHFERIADHAVNVAERVHFMITGRMESLATLHKPPLSN